MIPAEEDEVPEWFRPLGSHMITRTKVFNDYSTLETFMSIKEKSW